MKNFLKENWFRLSTLLILSATSIVALYIYNSNFESKLNLQSAIQSTSTVTEQGNTTNSVPTQQTVIYTNPVKEANQLKLEACIDNAEREYNRIVEDLSAKVANGELNSSYFGPSVDALIKRKAEQKADCLTKYN